MTMQIPLTVFEQGILDGITGVKKVNFDSTGATPNEIRNDQGKGAYFNGTDIIRASRAFRLEDTYPCLLLNPNSKNNRKSGSTEEGIKIENLPAGKSIYIRGKRDRTSRIHMYSDGSRNSDALVGNRNRERNAQGLPIWQGNVIAAGDVNIIDMIFEGGDDAAVDCKIDARLRNCLILPGKKAGYKAWGRQNVKHYLSGCTIDMREVNHNRAFRLSYESAKIFLFNHRTIDRDGVVHNGIPPESMVQFAGDGGETPTMASFTLLDSDPLPGLSPFFVDDDGEIPPVDPPDPDPDPDPDLEHRVFHLEEDVAVLENDVSVLNDRVLELEDDDDEEGAPPSDDWQAEVEQRLADIEDYLKPFGG